LLIPCAQEVKTESEKQEGGFHKEIFFGKCNKYSDLNKFHLTHGIEFMHKEYEQLTDMIEDARVTTAYQK
jgi:hypothetical protein